jgi:hypothetical protein
VRNRHLLASKVTNSLYTICNSSYSTLVQPVSHVRNLSVRSVILFWTVKPHAIYKNWSVVSNTGNCMEGASRGLMLGLNAGTCQESLNFKLVGVPVRIPTDRFSVVPWATSMPWRMSSSGMLRRVALVGTDVTLMLPWWWRRQVPPKSQFLQEPYGVTSQKTPFFT